MTRSPKTLQYHDVVRIPGSRKMCFFLCLFFVSHSPLSHVWATRATRSRRRKRPTRKVQVLPGQMWHWQLALMPLLDVLPY